MAEKLMAEALLFDVYVYRNSYFPEKHKKLLSH
jgi:hypothetical protein